MLITYLAQGRPHYPSEDGSIAYISDIGADILKPLFITGCAITALSFFLSLTIERWLRHSGRYVSVFFSSPFVFLSLGLGVFFVSATVSFFSQDVADCNCKFSLVPDMRRRERVLACFAILGSFIGGLGLLLLSIFDTRRFPSLHRVFLLVFIVGVGLSAIFTIIEVRVHLRSFRHRPQHNNK